MALASGTRLGAYEIVALIGAGGMGEVYRAQRHTAEARRGYQSPARDICEMVLSGWHGFSVKPSCWLAEPSEHRANLRCRGPRPDPRTGGRAEA
jgi:hypothetical protein